MHLSLEHLNWNGKQVLGHFLHNEWSFSSLPVNVNNIVKINNNFIKMSKKKFIHSPSPQLSTPSQIFQ